VTLQLALDYQVAQLVKLVTVKRIKSTELKLLFVIVVGDRVVGNLAGSDRDAVT
jgi:hypothetical protein